MDFFTGFLTFVLFLNCIILMLLVLIQLPKKEAGAGLAFGGGTTDALFGAGSGNALTKLTKYSATLFLSLALVLSFLNSLSAQQDKTRLEQAIDQQASASQPLAPAAASTNLAATPAPAPATTNLLQTLVVTNLPAATSNAPLTLQPEAVEPAPVAPAQPEAKIEEPKPTEPAKPEGANPPPAEAPKP